MKVARFKTFENNSKLIFHTSYDTIPSLTSQPMFFALSREDAQGWYDNALMDNGQAFIYSAKINIVCLADLESDVFKPFFAKMGISIQDYVADLLSNPDEQQILSEEGTRLLIKHGFCGVKISDYDPTDFQKDKPSILVFDPKQTVTDWKLVYPKTV